ncbi:hypothetical protein SH1V18_06170 [Vallitalea longa]|uniref:DUF1189 domain-containing protein n=1 Tax=Vallitalea longa TaxID=2936439 RepID=A0A9W5Y7R6_9FIRM|nr:DUF1189 domain-containing protein [Vallitalea longa]GKX28137.1 hypothetical protein SH1V18_06170 [Vallitalea longa]
MEKTGNPNIFTKFIKSFTDFRVYNRIRSESLGKSFLYLILLSLIIGVVFSIVIVSKTNDSIDSTIEFLESDDMPNITVSNGILDIDMDKPLIVSQDNEFIFIVDMTSEYDLNDLVGYSIGYLVTPERIIISQAGSPPMPLEFKALSDFNINKESVLDMIQKFRGIVVGIIIFITIAGTILFNLFASLLLSVMGTISNSILNANLSYSELYKIGIYALTLPAIIILILNCFGIGIAFAWKILIYLVISTIIITMALKNIIQNNNNNPTIDNNNDSYYN